MVGTPTGSNEEGLGPRCVKSGRIFIFKFFSSFTSLLWRSVRCHSFSDSIHLCPKAELSRKTETTSEWLLLIISWQYQHYLAYHCLQRVTESRHWLDSYAQAGQSCQILRQISPPVISAEAHLTLTCSSLQNNNCYHLNNDLVELWESCEHSVKFLYVCGQKCVLWTVRKSRYVCLPPDTFPLSLMGLNVAVGRCSRQLNTHLARSFCNC